MPPQASGVFYVWRV